MLGVPARPEEVDSCRSHSLGSSETNIQKLADRRVSYRQFSVVSTCGQGLQACVWNGVWRASWGFARRTDKDTESTLFFVLQQRLTGTCGQVVASTLGTIVPEVNPGTLG